MKIGVFDSGIGGKAVAQRLQQLIPNADILFVSDSAHVPYGTRPPEEIIALTDAAIQPLLIADCDAIVLACNTATTIAITNLRARYPAMNFVGIEPMVKPAAAQSKAKHIAVLATSATLHSERYAELKNEWATGVIVEEPDCQDWAALIEAGRSDEVPVENTVEKLTNDGVDMIVLACTHYHWLVERAEQAANGRATILEPSDAIGRRILMLLGAAD